MVKIISLIIGFFAGHGQYKEVARLRKENPAFFIEYNKLVKDAKALQSNIEKVNKKYGIN